jgi:hydroxyacyl-ACP dehydratase HTD2-like protein with hotdog domain
MTDKPPETLGPLRKQPTEITLFRFSAATWNAHRLHYDAPFAHSEGAAAPLAQAYLFGAYLAQLVQDWAGPRSRVLKLDYRSRKPIPVGTELVCSGRVVGWRGEEADLELEISVGDQRCVEATATAIVKA